MKKNLIALAVASAVVAAPAAMADAKVYGQVHVSLDKASGTDMNMTDRDSRIGVKGSNDLNHGLKAVYQMEFGVKVGDKFDTSTDSKAFSGRNTFVGLAGDFGTVLFGRHDTPLKMSQAKFDLFGDTASDIAKPQGKVTGEVRGEKVVAYVSPSFSGVTVVAAQVQDGDSTTDWTSYAVNYDGMGIHAAYAADNTQADDRTRFTAYYKNDMFQVGAMMEETENAAGTTTNDVTVLNAAYFMGDFTFAIQNQEDDKDVTGANKTMTFGVMYSLGKGTTAYVARANENNGGTDTTTIGLVTKF
jgi:predicted porin